MAVYQLSFREYVSMAGAIPVASITIRTWKGVRNPPGEVRGIHFERGELVSVQMDSVMQVFLSCS